MRVEGDAFRTANSPFSILNSPLIKAGGHPDLISAAKLLQSFLALDFIANYCDLLRLSEREMAQIHLYYIEMQRIAPRKTIFRTAHL